MVLCGLEEPAGVFGKLLKDIENRKWSNAKYIQLIPGNTPTLAYSTSLV